MKCTLKDLPEDFSIRCLMFEHLCNIFGYLDIWIFGGGRSRNKIWTENSLSGHVNFFTNLDNKSQVLTFGWHLAAIWNIQIFGYLNI